MTLWWDRVGWLWNSLWAEAHAMGLGSFAASDEVLDAVLLGLMLGGAALGVLGALNLYQALSLHIAGRRVLALVALPVTRPGGELKKELLAAFGHSRRLKEVAERFLSQAEIVGSDQADRVDGSRSLAEDRNDQDTAAEKGGPISTVWVFGTAITLIGFGGVGIPCLLIGVFGPASVTVASGSAVDLTDLLYALRLGALFAFGCGVAGLLGLLEWRVLGALQRSAMRRLKLSVDQLIASTSSGEAIMIAYARQIGASYKALEKLLKDEKKARALERRDLNDRLDRAVAQIEQSIQSMNDCTTASTELCGLIRQSMDTIIGTQEGLKEMIEGHRLQTSAALQSLQADEAKRTAKEQVLAVSVRESVARLTGMIDSLSNVIESLSRPAAPTSLFNLPPESAEMMLSELQSMLVEFEETDARPISVRETLGGASS